MSVSISEQLDQGYKQYCRYVIQERAIPSIIDGLKPVQRRILDIAKTKAKTAIKVSTLAGRAMKLHPHGDGPLNAAASLMGQQFAGSNNYAYFDGIGTFGGRITGRGTESIGAPRYISVKNSDVFRELLQTDIGITNEGPNYDKTTKEIKNFLPIFPTILLNPIRGIAVGFAVNIQPYNPLEVIDNQISVLREEKQDDIIPWYRGFNGSVVEVDGKVYSRGKYKFVRKTQLRITELPINYDREKYVKKLNKLIDEEDNSIKTFEDNCHGDKFDFLIKLKRDNPYHDAGRKKIYDVFSLESKVNENITALDFNEEIKSYDEVNNLIRDFTLWRLKKYKKRYSHMLDHAKEKAQKLIDFIKVAKSGIISKLGQIDQNKAKKKLENLLGKTDVNKILNMPIRKFSKDNVDEARKDLKQLKNEIKTYKNLISNKEDRKQKYIEELQELKSWFKERM